MHRRIERFINAPTDSVFLAPSVSHAQAAIAACFPEPTGMSRNKILISQWNFNSARYLWGGMAARGFHVSEFDQINIDHITPKVHTIVLPLVSPGTGELIELGPIVEKARKTGTIVMVDAFHALGIVPVDVAKLGADVVVGGLSKWVGAPDFGCCFGYVSEELSNAIEPPAPGWLGHETPFGFEGRWKPARGAGKFRSGAPVMLPLYTAVPALNWIERVGIDAIRARSVELTTHTHMIAVEEGFEILSPEWPDDRGGMVVLDVPEPERIVAALKPKGLIVDVGNRPNTMRLGPHPTMTEEECEYAVVEIRRVVRNMRNAAT